MFFYDGEADGWIWAECVCVCVREGGGGGGGGGEQGGNGRIACVSTLSSSSSMLAKVWVVSNFFLVQHRWMVADYEARLFVCGSEYVGWRLYVYR